MLWIRIGAVVGVLALLGSLGSVSAQKDTGALPQAPSSLSTLWMDPMTARSVISVPASGDVSPGPEGGTVWALPGKGAIKLALPNPGPVPQPGPAWQPVTVWGERIERGAWIWRLVAPPGVVWGQSGANLPTVWDADTGILTILLP